MAEGVILPGFQRDMANLSNRYGKKPVLVFIIDPRNKTRAVDNLISSTEILSAAKGIRYTLQVELFAARDKDQWEFLKYQMRILENMLHELHPSPQTHPITLIFSEHDTARADPHCPCSDIPNRSTMQGYLKRYESRGGIRYRVNQAFFQPWAADFVEFAMQGKK